MRLRTRQEPAWLGEERKDGRKCDQGRDRGKGGLDGEEEKKERRAGGLDGEGRKKERRMRGEEKERSGLRGKDTRR